MKVVRSLGQQQDLTPFGINDRLWILSPTLCDVGEALLIYPLMWVQRCFYQSLLDTVGNTAYRERHVAVLRAGGAQLYSHGGSVLALSQDQYLYPKVMT